MELNQDIRLAKNQDIRLANTCSRHRCAAILLHCRRAGEGKLLWGALCLQAIVLCKHVPL